jgi:DNA-binding response OmpR family regulator
MRVLVIEDERRLAHAIERGLHADGIAVDVAYDGRDGLWHAQEGAYDAIVLDLLLPGMNGYRVCQALREQEIWTPILILTAKDGEWDEADGLDLGADDFVSKPFSLVVLSARLRALARRGLEARPSVLRVGDLSLDPATRSCVRAEVPIKLTLREYLLLECLMRRAGTVLSKPQLLDRVWGSDFEGDSNIVEVYICYLRRKIDEPFERHSIQTVRGAGYTITPDQVADVASA